MNIRLLVGQPAPPEPPERPHLRTHEVIDTISFLKACEASLQGLPGMGNFKRVPASSPAGLLKPLAPVDFRYRHLCYLVECAELGGNVSRGVEKTTWKVTWLCNYNRAKGHQRVGDH
eukprot:scaffold532786_cov46-Prasinocladus_malaysianus.AAC.1